MRDMGEPVIEENVVTPAVGLLAARRQSLPGEPIESGRICEALDYANESDAGSQCSVSRVAGRTVSEINIGWLRPG